MDLCFTRILLLLRFLLLFSPSNPKLAERNSTISGHMVRSKCDFKTYVRNLRYPLPYKLGAKAAFYGRLRNTTANLTAYIFGTKHDIDNWASPLTTTTSDFLYRLKKTRTLVHERLKTGPPFYSPYANSAFYFIARLRRRTSANRIQPNVAKRWKVNRANNLL